VSRIAISAILVLAIAGALGSIVHVSRVLADDGPPPTSTEVMNDRDSGWMPVGMVVIAGVAFVLTFVYLTRSERLKRR
jgi:hypothetical protein